MKETILYCGCGRVIDTQFEYCACGRRIDSFEEVDDTDETL